MIWIGLGLQIGLLLKPLASVLSVVQCCVFEEVKALLLRENENLN